MIWRPHPNPQIEKRLREIEAESGERLLMGRCNICMSALGPGGKCPAEKFHWIYLPKQKPHRRLQMESKTMSEKANEHAPELWHWMHVNDETSAMTDSELLYTLWDRYFNMDLSGILKDAIAAMGAEGAEEYGELCQLEALMHEARLRGEKAKS